MEQKNKKIMLSIIGIAVLVIGLVGITYAFFNYTRTGSSNVIKTGRISFTTSQGTPINLTNMFPIEPTQANLSDSTKVGTVTIDVTGDTTYSQGVEYLVTATNVQNTVGSGANQKSVPISITVEYAAKENKVIGTPSSNYFEDRGSTTSYYKVLSSDTISDGDRLLVGYIKPDNTGIDGTITIKAYLDKNKIAISDTYPEQTIRTVKTTGYSSSDCETALTGVTNASTYCATASSLQSAIDNGNLTSAQIALLVNAGIVEEYTNGTPSSFGEGKVVLTIDEWNSLQQDGLSFQIKVEANQGVWVKKQTTLALASTRGMILPGESTTVQISTTGTGVVSCSSSDSTKATCSIDNNVLTVNNVTGDATITVSQVGGDLEETPSDVVYNVVVPICKRVTDVSQLHTETCNNQSPIQNGLGQGSYTKCGRDGYRGANSTITYGNAVPLGTETLSLGDAFDCKLISSNGYYFRLYYVSPYYDTFNDTFDSDYGVFVKSNSSGSGGNTYKYDYVNYDNLHGPVSSLGIIAPTSTFDNIELKTTSRQIWACDDYDCNTKSLTAGYGNNLIENPFSYEGRSGRLLTLIEIKQSGCDRLSGYSSLHPDIAISGVGLKACNFLLEGTKYANSSNTIDYLWLENPYSNKINYSSFFENRAFVVASGSYISYVSVTSENAYPLIAYDIPLSKIMK